jgi:hypothetical protein
MIQIIKEKALKIKNKVVNLFKKLTSWIKK